MKRIIATAAAITVLAAGTAVMAHGGRGHRQAQTCPDYGYCQVHGAYHSYGECPNAENCPNKGVRQYDGRGCHGSGVCAY